MFSSWSRTQRSTPQQAAGGSLTLRAESRATGRCTRPASPATRLRKIATMSSPVTHLDVTMPKKGSRMSTIHLHQTTTSTPEQYVAGLTDLGPCRSNLFGNSADEYLKGLGAFMRAVTELFGPEQARVAAEDWVDELEFVDILPEPAGRDWRSVTIAAAARLAKRLNVDADRRTPRDTPADTKVSPILSSNCPAAIRLA